MKNHYERLICLCCFLLFFVNIGLPSTSFSVFMPYLAALPDVGNTGSSLIISFRTLVSLTCLLFVNRFVDRLGARKAATAAASAPPASAAPIRQALRPSPEKTSLSGRSLRPNKRAKPDTLSVEKTP